MANATGEFRRNTNDGRPEVVVRVGTDEYLFSLINTGTPAVSAVGSGSLFASG
jgi:hypothetical protein